MKQTIEERIAIRMMEQGLAKGSAVDISNLFEKCLNEVLSFEEIYESDEVQSAIEFLKNRVAVV